jgi:glyoxylase-like metal-dependent hydrolase (beta-lactamase superfamily II)
MCLKHLLLPVTPYAQNCSLIGCSQTGKGAIIDPGGDLEEILELVTRSGLTIERLLITHGHFDHCGVAAELAERLQVPIEGPHQEDEFLLQSLPEWCVRAGFPIGRAFTPQRYLDDGDLVQVGELSLQVLHCPGHTPGHVAFYQPQARMAFVGDILFRGSIGRSDFPRSDPRQLLMSIQHKLFPLGDEVTIVPGHGPLSTLGYERQHNPFVRMR